MSRRKVGQWPCGNVFRVIMLRGSVIVIVWLVGARTLALITMLSIRPWCVSVCLGKCCGLHSDGFWTTLTSSVILLGVSDLTGWLKRNLVVVVTLRMVRLLSRLRQILPRQVLRTCVPLKCVLTISVTVTLPSPWASACEWLRKRPCISRRATAELFRMILLVKRPVIVVCVTVDRLTLWRRPKLWLLIVRSAAMISGGTLVSGMK